ncbi:hypothetical protein [Chryseobacterium sp. Alg-005]|uniref:hypothetical protein n=1 Tax=Chryseobacterium sp. Alg-005 TaxID=3159516 RepID=UPI0036F199D0
MKKLIIFIVTACLGLFFLSSCFKANDIIIHDGRCIGATNCSICSNCSSCGHCSSGGTCGVCIGRTSGRAIYNSSSQKNKIISKVTPESILYDDSVIYYAKKEIVKIYKGPGFEFAVVEKIKQGSKLVEIEKNGDWLYIKIWKTGTEGFVFQDDVKN